MVPIHLTKDGGKQHDPAYRAINPHMRVPSLVLGGGEILTQSIAIIEYLDEVHPEPPLLPQDAMERARVRAAAQLIACDIHPLNNLATLKYLKNGMGKDQAAIDTWYHHWITNGFDALEPMLKLGRCAICSHVTLAGVCVVPLRANAGRFKVPLDQHAKSVAVDAECL